MKKRFIALTSAAVMAASAAALPASSASALDAAPIKGDVNVDWSINIADLVSMQRYLLGVDSPNEVGLANADVNSDGNVDIFDFVALRQMIESPQDIYKCEFTHCADSLPPDGTGYGTPRKEAVISSVEELEDYFSPAEAALQGAPKADGKSAYFRINVASQEVIDSFMEKYDKEFFKTNNLYLNYLHETECDFRSISFDEETSSIVISYTSEKCAAFDGLVPPIIAQMALPKKLVNKMTVNWEETFPEVVAEITTDYTTDVPNSTVLAALAEHEPEVFSSTAELSEYITGKVGRVVSDKLIKRYGDRFFEKNVLILDLSFTDYLGSLLEVSATGDDDGTVALTYTYIPESYESVPSNSLQITQIAVPRENYHGKVRTKYINSAPADVSFGQRTIDYSWFKDVNDNEPVWINSLEEYKNYIYDTFVDEAYCDIVPYDELIDYAPENWDEKSLYIFYSDEAGGDTLGLAGAKYCDKTNDLMLTMNRFRSTGDVIVRYLNILTVDKAQVNANVRINELKLNEIFPFRNEPATYFYTSYLPQFAIVEHCFNGQYSADVYHARPTYGFVPYNGYTYVGSLDFYNGGCNKSYFSSDYGSVSNQMEYNEEDGSYSYSSDNYYARLNTDEDGIQHFVIGLSDVEGLNECEFTFDTNADY